MHDRQIVPVGPAQATNDPIDVPPSIYEQGTQICKAVVPVPAQSVLAPSSPLIVVRNLKKAYARRLAVNDVSSCVERGEFVIVTGPVGAGKSTLLHILAGMVRPSRGDYWLAECNIKHLSLDKLAMLRNQQLGFIGQQPNLLPHTSALKNVALPLLYAGFSEVEQKRRAQKVLQAIGLNTRMLYTPEQLSPGQQQRVAIARALVNSPALLLADEPTGNMDMRSEREIMAVLQALNQRKLTIILATQNMDLAVYATRHIVLRDGCIIGDELIKDRCMALDELGSAVAIGTGVQDKSPVINVPREKTW